MSQSEWKAIAELLGLLLTDRRMIVLITLLVIAATIDYRSHRIPNWLVLTGMFFGVIYNIMVPPFPHASYLWPLEGLGLGFIAFLPLYMLGVMGAGDVKLMAMVGAIIGPVDVAWALLCTMIVGGALSIVLVLTRGTVQRLLENFATVFQLTYLDAGAGVRPRLHFDETVSAGKLPYGVAIAMGTIGYLLLHSFGYL
jgi:prepilin peptidase CpaA